MAIRFADGLSMVAVLIAVACCTSVGVPAEGATVASSCRAKEDSCDAALPVGRGEANALAQRLSTVSAMEAIRQEQDKLKVDEHEAKTAATHGNEVSVSHAGSATAASSKTVAVRKKAQVSFNDTLTKRRVNKTTSAKKTLRAVNSSRHRRKVGRKETKQASLGSTSQHLANATTKVAAKASQRPKKPVANTATEAKDQVSQVQRSEGKHKISPVSHKEQAKDKVAEVQRLEAKHKVAQVSRKEQAIDHGVLAATLKAYAQQQRQQEAVHATGVEAKDKVAEVQRLEAKHNVSQVSRKEQAKDNVAEVQHLEAKHKVSQVSRKEQAKDKVAEVQRLEAKHKVAQVSRKEQVKNEVVPVPRPEAKHKVAQVSRKEEVKSKVGQVPRPEAKHKLAQVSRKEKVKSKVGQVPCPEATHKIAQVLRKEEVKSKVGQVPRPEAKHKIAQVSRKEEAPKKVQYKKHKDLQKEYPKLVDKSSGSNNTKKIEEHKAGNATKSSNAVPLLQALRSAGQVHKEAPKAAEQVTKKDPMGMSKASMKVSTLPEDQQHHNHKTYSQDWQKEYPKFVDKSSGSNTTKKNEEEPTKQKEAKAGAAGLVIHALLPILVAAALYG